MPAQQATGGLLKKFGSGVQNVVKKAIAEPVNYGNLSLPPGIKEGIARLTSIKFDKYKEGSYKGEVYCQLRGVVVEVVSPSPFLIDGKEVTIAGRQTSQMIGIHDKKDMVTKKVTKSWEEGLAKVIEEFRKLGGPEFVSEGDDLEELAPLLVEAKPYFKFSTSVRNGMIDQKTGKKGEDGVWENWYGSKDLEDYVPPDNDATEIQDEAPTESQNPNPQIKPPFVNRNAPTKETEPAPAFDEFGDLKTLAEKADKGDKKALKEFQTKVFALGITTEQIEAAATYSEVLDLLNSGDDQNAPREETGEAVEGEEEAPAEEEAPPEVWAPKVGEFCKYNTINKDKKPWVRDVTILTINEKNGTATLKDMTTKKTIMGSDGKPLQIKLDKLSE